METLIQAREQLRYLREAAGLSAHEIAQHIGASLASIEKWERGDISPGPSQIDRIVELSDAVRRGDRPRAPAAVNQERAFASRGARRGGKQPDLFEERFAVALSDSPLAPILTRLKQGSFVGTSAAMHAELLDRHREAARTVSDAISISMSAGKNTYTYDAHTYHTKVPPQGIADLIRYYLPEGGLVLDPFAGSGMTGVAALAGGADVILNELSPAAAFISDRFTSSIAAEEFAAGVRAMDRETAAIRFALYGTECRECGKRTEILYTVWSYKVLCATCGHEFLLWDQCRRYGASVREHKILSEFGCPACGVLLKKSRLARTNAEPVLLGYKCCRPVQIEHPLSQADLQTLRKIENAPPLADGFYPTAFIPDGVNLRQPCKHGLDRIDKFYTPRNLAALSQLWHAIHRVCDDNLAAFLAFAFTSLYQRVTRLSEFRFWGGSGNTAHFNVPFIFNEANVFVTFLRKARSIQDHLETTAAHYSGRKSVICGSATNLSSIPDHSVDLIFTDPPFGANINYSEMNVLWESWLGQFTDPTEEAVINRVQKKALADYQNLMLRSLREAYRCLRPGHWLLLVFMNSSAAVWGSLRNAVLAANFRIERVDIFDKQHGTFKQFVSENTAGADLVLHCRKPDSRESGTPVMVGRTAAESIAEFVASHSGTLPRNIYLHVARDEEIDFRLLYSEWLSQGFAAGDAPADFATFRNTVIQLLPGKGA